jgi:hypothetical protein
MARFLAIWRNGSVFPSYLRQEKVAGSSPAMVANSLFSFFDYDGDEEIFFGE